MTLFKVGRFKENVVGTNASIVAMLPISFAIGFFATHDNSVACGVMACVLVANYICFCRLATIEFGSQGLLTRQTSLHLLLAILAWLAGCLPWALTYDSHDTLVTDIIWKVSNIFLVILPSGLVVLAGARTFPVVGCFACLMRGLAPQLLFEREPPAAAVWTAFISAAFLLPVGFTKYRTEECSLAFMPLVIATSIHTGAQWGVNLSEAGWILVSMLSAYTQILWMRRKRVLPPSLKGCKFVSLAYLRKIAASGEGIQRCQDLPPEAFGDPRKAKYLIVVSHRWMDRYTCDVKTTEFPEGLRLHMLLKKMESIFSTAGIGAGRGILDRIGRFRYGMTGGSDVLVFLDFMSLPQIGKSKDGTLLDRTEREMRTFEQCLPSMGLLYSMFPVLVSQEVTEDCPKYLDSGWCFSESSTAWLGSQLALFPSNADVSQWLDEEVSTKDGLQSVGRKLDRMLANKMFLYNSDRSIARTMIGGFVLKSRLAHAVLTKSVDGLETVLEDLMEGGFDSIVNQPMDAASNTPLHYAVRCNFSKGVRLLLDAGAEKHVRNLYGDTPVQYYMFPCLRGAANLCRRLPSNLPAAERSQDSFSKFACHYTFSAAFGENSTCGSFVDTPSSSPVNTACLEHFSFPDYSVLHIGSEDGPQSSGTPRRVVSLDGLALGDEGAAADQKTSTEEVILPDNQTRDGPPATVHIESL